MLHWVRLPNNIEVIAWVDNEGISWYGDGENSFPGAATRDKEGYVIGPKIPSWSKLEGLPKSIKAYGLACTTMEATRMLGMSLGNMDVVDKANDAEAKVLATVLEGL